MESEEWQTATAAKAVKAATVVAARVVVLAAKAVLARAGASTMGQARPGSLPVPGVATTRLASDWM